MKSRKYKCQKCKAVVKRKSDKQWIKSFCSSTGAMTRLMIVKNK